MEEKIERYWWYAAYVWCFASAAFTIAAVMFGGLTAIDQPGHGNFSNGVAATLLCAAVLYNLLRSKA